MALIDYGAILRVAGKFINKDEFFMKSSDTGYTCEKATDEEGYTYDIQGNYFVYAGDENFMLVFYKNIVHWVSHDRILHSVAGTGFASETFFVSGCPDVTIEHLDKQKYPDTTWLDLDNYDDILYFYGKRYADKWKSRRIKRNLRYIRNKSTWDWSNRFLAKWEYDGRKYECIFGYGIDPQEEVWRSIRNDGYDFSDTERDIIDSWFHEPMDVIEVSKHIIRQCSMNGKPVDISRLSNMLYTLQYNYLKNGELAFTDDFEAFYFGPTVDKVFCYYSMYCGTPVYGHEKGNLTKKEIQKIDEILFEEKSEKKRYRPSYQAWRLIYQDGHYQEDKNTKYAKSGFPVIPKELIKQYG